MFGVDGVYATGVELGTSKISVAVAEVTPQNPFKLLAVGQSPSSGIRKGMICDVSAVERELRTAVRSAEQQANVTIGDVCLGLTGSCIRTYETLGSHNVQSPDGRVTKEDKHDVTHNAIGMRKEQERPIVQWFKQSYYLDGREYLENPEGKSAKTLTRKIFWMDTDTTRYNVAKNIVEGLSLRVSHIIFCGYASSLMMLSEEQRNQSGLLIDMGAGTTEYTYIEHGKIKYSDVLTVGGDHISNDLALGLNVDLGVAESLKKTSGRAVSDPQARGSELPYIYKDGRRGKVRFDHFQKIMELRIRETLQIIKESLDDYGVDIKGTGGVIMLAGGCAQIQYIRDLAKSIFGVNVLPYKGLLHGNQPSNIFTNPQFATVLGLTYYHAMTLARNKKMDKGIFGHWFGL